MKRREIIAGAAGMLLAAPAIAQSRGDWPNQPIRLVVPFAAGGPTDVPARLLAEELSKILPQRVVVENRTGAGVVVGSDAVAKAPKDGHTLLYNTIAHSVLRPMFPQLPFDPVADFSPIALVGQVPMLLLVNRTLPAKDLRELIGLFKENPGKYSYASSGMGGAVHLASALFLTMAGNLQVQHVPYRGSAAAMPDLLTGQVAMLIDVGTSAMSYVERGELRALAVGSKERVPMAPQVPTLDEAGVPGYEAYTWHMLLAPSGTPQPVIEAANKAVNTVLEQQPFQKRLLEMSMQPRPGSTPAQAAAFLKSEMAKWEPIVQQVDLKAR